jgi:DNA-binding transcriptional MerR regulator
MDDLGTKPLTLPQVADIAEVEYARLHSWVKRGLLAPSILASTGTGSPNLFSRQDALKARILADLSRAGVDFSSLEEAARELERNGDRLDGEAVLAVNGSVEFLDPSSSLAEIDEPMIIYPLALARSAAERFPSS